MEKQIFLSGMNRPDGVSILIPGGLKGYSDGNISIPWYSPPWYGESGGPRCFLLRRYITEHPSLSTYNKEIPCR
jgi:hypothetical protein